MALSKPTMTVAKCLAEWTKVKQMEAENRGIEYELDEIFWFRPSRNQKSGSTGGDCRFPSTRIEDFAWKEFDIYLRKSDESRALNSGTWTNKDDDDKVFATAGTSGVDERTVKELILSSEKWMTRRLNTVRLAVENSLEEVEGRIRREVSAGQGNQTFWIESGTGPVAVTGSSFLAAEANKDANANANYRRLSAEADAVQEKAEGSVKRAQKLVACLDMAAPVTVPTTRAKFARNTKTN